MTRLEAIIAERKARRLRKLDAAADAVRTTASRHGVPVGLFGSYARRTVGPGSDLDVLVLGHGASRVTEAFRREMERIGADQDIAIDLRLEKDAPHLSADIMP